MFWVRGPTVPAARISSGDGAGRVGTPGAPGGLLPAIDDMRRVYRPPVNVRFRARKKAVTVSVVLPGGDRCRAEQADLPVRDHVERDPGQHRLEPPLGLEALAQRGAGEQRLEPGGDPA